MNNTIQTTTNGDFKVIPQPTETEFLNGYKIRWNPLFKIYTVREPETGAGEDFATIQEARNHAIKG